ncbi:hypothetical protein BU17DRAFT_65112 [Hysterangium stoloniferum]|nr:hypothetical protein BU17DRAFT_65112 [Hysterangium stoloniferum]
MSKSLPRRITPTALNVRFALLDPVSAWVGSILLGSCLIVIIVPPVLCGQIYFDFAWDYYKSFTNTLDISVLDREKPSSDKKSIPRVNSPVEDSSIPGDVPKTVAPTSQTQGTVPPSNPMLKNAFPVDGKQTKKNPTNKRPQSMVWERDLCQFSSIADAERQDSFPLAESTPVNSVSSGLGPINGETAPEAVTMGINKQEVSPSTDLPSVESVSVLSKQIKFTTKAHTNNLDRRATLPLLPVNNIFPSTQLKKILTSQPSADSFSSVYSRLESRFPTFFTALPWLPFALVPFAFSQFILIRGFAHQVWIEVFVK